MTQTHVFAGKQALANAWYCVALSSDADPGPLKVTLLGEDYAIWRDPEGELVGVPDRCSHREAPLSAGNVKDGCLECCYHGWQFSTGGRCVSVPSSQKGIPIPPRAHLEAVNVAEKYGLIWVCPGAPEMDIPYVPWEDDPSFRRINPEVDIWNVSSTRMVDNFLDFTHFPFVHSGTFGGATDQEVPRLDMLQLDKGFFGYWYDVRASNPDLALSTSGQDEAVVYRKMSSGFSMPFHCRSTIHYETGLVHVLLLLSTPIDDVTSYFTFVVWRNDDFSVPEDEVLKLDKAIAAEDKAMLERLGGVLPLRATELVSVQADKLSVEWMRRFSALVSN